MKRLTALNTLMLFLAILALLSGPAASHLQAKKSKTRPVDKITYPALNKFSLPDIQKAQTDNGIKLRLIKDDKLPLVTVRILLKGGDAYDPMTKVGLSSITADLLRIGGTGSMKPEDFDRMLDANGITLDLNSTNSYFTISLSCLQENLDQSLSLLAKVLTEPAFDDEKLEELKTKLSTSISRRNDQPDSINRREFDRLIYGDKSPFAAVLEYKHLDNISKQDIIKVYHQFFAADNMLVGVTGPLEMPEFKELIEKHLGQWTTKAKIPAFPKAPEQSHDFKVAFAQKGNINQSYLSIGHMGELYNRDEKANFMMFNTIFSEGVSSRLMNRVRVKMGLTYGIGGGIYTNYLYPGKTYFSTFTKCESTIDAIKAIFDEIDKIRTEPVTPEELQESKDYFMNSFVFKYSSPAKILMNSLRKEFYGIEKEDDKKFLEDIEKVTAQDVLETAKKFLHPEKLVVFVVTDKNKLKGDLSELGKVKEIDITIAPPELKEKIPPATPELLAKGQKMIDTLANDKYKKYKALKSVRSHSKMKMTMGGRTMEMSLVSSVLYPDKVYVEISFMGMKMLQVINGNKGYMSQMGQKKPLPSDQLEKQKFGDLYDVLNAKDKYKFQYLKEEEIDGKTYDVIYIFDANKNWKKIYINRDTGLIEISEKMDQGMGASGIARTVNSELKIIKGIPFFLNSKVYMKDKVVREIITEKVEINPQLDTTLFKIEE